MAKQNMIEREKKRNKLIQKYYRKRKEIKGTLNNNLTFIEQLEIQRELQKLPKNSTPCRRRNRCWKTGRSRGFYKDFGLSRHVLREMSHNCLLPGVRKASW
uniref:Small ribosomal subunit protein uS14c n=1 Tax=Gracilaria tenuistipitata var. liui TaxID=285951 RepID=RR14_GRATL|nr:ribosomal protein S14 [Gracilaria tenuistipitata var. liui]Q6B8U8.1 RecName: Full=Small ribosomal subunit protein uS14c; AltName: Full=30S ribosomal protein S14, chloroplastic [Gracilaria tenuistipitata var. liui]AAT79687.1 30S ribosomal protein S14 [Gracilaria tenuistipitata var. liui]